MIRSVGKPKKYLFLIRLLIFTECCLSEFKIQNLLQTSHTTYNSLFILSMVFDLFLKDATNAIRDIKIPWIRHKFSALNLDLTDFETFI